MFLVNLGISNSKKGRCSKEPLASHEFLSDLYAYTLERTRYVYVYVPKQTIIITINKIHKSIFKRKHINKFKLIKDVLYFTLIWYASVYLFISHLKVWLVLCCLHHYRPLKSCLVCLYHKLVILWQQESIENDHERWLKQ